MSQKTEYLKLKKKVLQTPLEKSFEKIIEKIDQGIDKILTLTQIEPIFLNYKCNGE
ncbi:MAG: hypothetical protein ACFFEO_11265 [Candidatus Thorarchaeota archaeon]